MKTCISILLFIFLLCPQIVLAENFLVPLHVKKDTNLIHIARDFCSKQSDWEKIAKINSLKPPYLILANSTLQVPLSLLKVEHLHAKIGSAHGPVTIQHKIGAKEKAYNGNPLSSGDILQTGDNGYTYIIFPDNRYARLEPNSKLIFNFLIRLTDGSVKIDMELEEGNFFNSVKKHLKPNDTHQIRTPLAITGIRGTEYRIKVTKTGEVFETLSGIVDVTAAQKAIALKENQGATVQAGQLNKYEVLPDTPKTPEIQPTFHNLPLQIPAPQHPTAEKLCLQIAVDKDGNTTLKKLYSEPGKAFSVKNLSNGTYYAFLSALDKNGLESPPSGPYTIVLRTDLAPLIVSQPANNSVFWTENVSVAWLERKESAHYLCQIAEDREFKSLVEEDVVDQPQFISKKLEPGQYFFRVKAVFESQEASLFSSPLCWTIPSQLQYKNNEVQPQGEVNLQWSSPYKDATYDLQVAEDDQFEKIVEEQHGLKASHHKLQQELIPGFYYVRVRTILADGTVGPWIDPQMLKVKGEIGWPEIILPATFLILICL